MPTWPSSLRARLTVSYTALLALPLIVFAIACYVVVSRTLERRTDLFINDALTAFARELGAERRSGLHAADAMRTTVEEVHFRDLHIAIMDSAGRVVTMDELPPEGDRTDRRPTSKDEARLLAALRKHDLSAPLALTVAVPPGVYRIVSQPLDLDGQRFSLTGSYSLADIESVLERIRATFLVAIPLLLASAAVGGYTLAKRSLAPVQSMTARAAAISASNMHERLPVGGGDELVGLSTMVNGLLDRLEGAFDQQRRFVTDASHELRTPTAVVLTEADVTLSREHRVEDEYRGSVTIIQDAARRLSRIVDDLFLLSRADSGHLATRLAPLYLEELLHDATRAVRSVASARGVNVVLGDVVDAPFRGDADLLGRLLLNLLDNALKHSPAGGVVDVSMTRRDSRYEIRVTDAGPGIPADARERVFERFYRVESARPRAENSSTSGAGLGLSIGRRIAEIHAGSVEIEESRPGRTTFLVTLPAPSNADG